MDDLIQRGRSQGHLSLSDLRTAFEQAGLTPAEARSILRELSEAGVRLADEETESRRSGAQGQPCRTLRPRPRTATVKGTAVRRLPPPRGAGQEQKASAERARPSTAATGTRTRSSGTTRSASIEADVAAFADAVDLDDQTPAMGDSVHTYLKSIGRTSLLTAEQEVDLAKRIEAGLFAEHKLDTEPDLSPELPPRP